MWLIHLMAHSSSGGYTLAIGRKEDSVEPQRVVWWWLCCLQSKQMPCVLPAFVLTCTSDDIQFLDWRCLLFRDATHTCRDRRAWNVRHTIQTLLRRLLDWQMSVFALHPEASFPWEVRVQVTSMQWEPPQHKGTEEAWLFKEEGWWAWGSLSWWPASRMRAQRWPEKYQRTAPWSGVFL